MPLSFDVPAWRAQVGREVETCRQAPPFYQTAFGKIMVQGSDAMAFLADFARPVDIPEVRLPTQILNAWRRLTIAAASWVKYLSANRRRWRSRARSKANA